MLRFIDFKGFADAQLDPWKPLTLLIGKNGSGKSNAIEAIELLAEVAHGRPLYEITDIGRGGAFEIRGGLQGCVRQGRQITSFEFVCNLPFEGGMHRSVYTLSLRAKPEPRIVAERLVVGSRTIFATEEGSEVLERGVLRVRYDNFARGGNKPGTTLPADRSVLSQYESFGAAERLAPARVSVSSLRDFLHAAFVFDPLPKTMRQYDRIGNRVLARHGGNISPVLHALETGTPSEKASLARILGGVKQLPEEPYESFAFVTTELNDVIFGLREREGGPIIDARVLSDGTLRSLAVLTAIETAKEGSRVVVEEFDNGLHPSRTGVLTQAIWDASKRRHLKILCTTHNPATLDALTKEQIEGVVLAVWDKAQQASRLVRLVELPRADVLLERGQLGDLVTRRIIEQYLAPDVEERAQKKTKAWLRSLP